MNISYVFRIVFATILAGCGGDVPPEPTAPCDAGETVDATVYANCSPPSHGKIITAQEPDGTWTCLWGSCERGWADCDGNPANGCEADLTLPQHCGTCQFVCLENETCSGGLSGIGRCD